MGKVAYLGVDERRALGKAARDRAPLADHAAWAPLANRADPIALLEAQDAVREADLVPVRHGRMMVSPFTFYRGTAKIMASDLAATPTAGLNAQLCGDAHLSNFGWSASPERTLLFDVDDFDETLPGPFEYDLKRKATSFTIAARHIGFAEADSRAATQMSVRSYREAMTAFAEMRMMDVWYSRLSEEDVFEALDIAVRAQTGPAKVSRSKARRSVEDLLAKARSRDSLNARGNLAELVDGQYRIVSKPPVVTPTRELGPQLGMSAEQMERTIDENFQAYRATLPDDRRQLLERFKVVDVARMVVGVGSVGTWSFIALLQGRDEDDPLFLQLKQANKSVLEDHLPASRYAHAGERVVQGQRLMQAASDICLGWTTGPKVGQLYWRQLGDMKTSVDVESTTPAGFEFYAQVCGRTLARAHARSGDPVSIAAYLGAGEEFDQAVADFAELYADQNDRDYQAFLEAVRSGRLEAVEGT